MTLDPVMDYLRSVLSVVWINRSCKPANPAFTMSMILRDARLRAPKSVFLSISIAALGSKTGGANRDRTDDLMLAKHALSQLSYGPG